MSVNPSALGDYVALLAGVACAGLGGELFVKGIVGVARWARMPPSIIAVTFAAFAGVSPELSVAVLAAVDGKPELSLGDTVGSSVVNIALVLALGLLIAGGRVQLGILRREYLLALTAPLLLGILCFDGQLGWPDAVVLLGMFLIWFTGVFREVRGHRRAARGAVAAPHDPRPAVIRFGLGMVLLIVAGRLVVHGAEGIALRYGIDEFLIGATLVALGTSMPELATTVISRLRGEQEVGISTVLGSNIFNLLFIVPVATLIHPIHFAWDEVAVGLIYAFFVVAFLFPDRSGHLGRRRGLLLLLTYAAYLASMTVEAWIHHVAGGAVDFG